MNRVVGMLWLLLLAGCEGVSPSILRVAAPRKMVVAPNEWTRSYPQSVHYIGITPGTYDAVFEDAGGTYFQGPRWCWSVRNVLKDPQKKQPPTVMVSCGVYLPHASSDEPKIWVTGPGVFFHSDGTFTDQLTGERVNLTTSEIATAMPGYTPPPGALPSTGSQAVGGAVGMAVVGGIIESERNNLRILADVYQPPQGQLRKWLSVSSN